MSLIISGRKHDYSTFDLGSLIMTVIKKNIFFVKLNDKFNELTTHDQKLILQKNMSEMCHIRGAIRFDTKSKNFVWYFSKRDQLQMAFEKKKPSSEAGTSSSSSSSSSSKNSRLSNALIGQQDMSKFYKSTTRSIESFMISFHKIYHNEVSRRILTFSKLFSGFLKSPSQTLTVSSTHFRK